jgi:stage II sporulation SpoAA-like protein
MPVTYHIDQSKQIIYTRCTGPVTLDEVRRHFVELSQDPDRPDRLDVLLDLSEMTTVPESDELRVVAGDIARLRPQVEFGICAIVATTPAVFGMSRVFEVFTERYFAATRVFRMEPDALGWLEAQRR